MLDPDRRRRPRAADRIGRRRRHRRRRREPRRCGARSERRAPNSPISSVIWWRCRSPTSAPRVRTRRGRPPTRCCMRCRRRCRGPGRRRAGPCCRLRAWRRGPRRCRPRGRRWSPTTTDCVTAEAITSTSPASRRSLQSLDPPFGSEGQAAVGLKRQQRAVARPAAQPADLSDLQLQGRLRPHLSAVGAPMARHARLARRTRAVRRPQVRHHRRPLRGVPRTQRRHRGAVRAADDGRAGGRGASARCADRRGPHRRRDVGVRPFSRRRCADFDTRLSPSATLAIPAGPFVVDGRHAGLVHPAPAAGRRRTRMDHTAVRRRHRPPKTR